MARNLLTTREAARQLGVTRRKLAQLVKEGRLSAVETVGLYKRFKPEEVGRLATELWGGQQVPTPPPPPPPPSAAEPSATEQMEPRAPESVEELVEESVEQPGLAAKTPSRKSPSELGDKRYLSAAEAAQILRVSPKTIARWASSGRLPHAKTLGGHRRYAASAIEQIKAQMLTPDDVALGESPESGGSSVQEAEEFLTTPQVARAVGVSPKTINRWADEGKIHAGETLGGHRRFHPSVLDELKELMASDSAREEDSESSTSGPAPAAPRKRSAPSVRVPKHLKAKRQKDPDAPGTSDNAWRATNISDVSKRGHKLAGPTMQYGDDT